jgi:GNAT superfamily N-acetyltransferase
MAEIYVTEARPSDLESLSTILARSFHPENPYQRKAQPDTPKIRNWYHRTFEDEINDKSCHPIVAIDSATDKDVGVLTLRRMEPGEKGAGFWSMYPLTDDHNKDMCSAFIDVMVEWREQLMGDRAHYFIELFGTEHAYKRTGVGSKMLKRACEIADQAGEDICVQANASGVGFYKKFGFTNEGELVMPGEDKYLETFMVRRYKKD